MDILPQEISDNFKFDALPGTVWYEVESFKSCKGRNQKVVMALNKTDKGWGTPSYAVLLEINGAWHLCPWIDDDVLNRLAKLVPPSIAFSRIPDASLTKLEEVYGTLENAIQAKIAQA
jgi:hypothetical protein